MRNNKSDRNIILVGMPGTGKTTVGELLSEMLGYGFIDTDVLVAHKTGKTPKQLVEEYGREYFIRVQDEVVLDIRSGNCVISTGGGLVHSDIAMSHLKKTGEIIFLNTSYQVIEDRMDASRKLVRTGGTLKDLYNERIPLYNKYADRVIECDGSEPDAICRKIIGFFENSADVFIQP